MHSSTPITPGSIFFSSVTLSAPLPGPNGIGSDVWHANRYLRSLREALPGTKSVRLASPARSMFTSVFELQADDMAKAATLCAAPSGQLPPGVMAVEQFVAKPIGLRKRADAGDWEKLLFETPAVFAIFFSVPESREQEFNRWYDEEHLGLLLACSDWLGCRRFRLATPHPFGTTHLAVHYLADLRALESPERDIAIHTPWRDRLATESWFKGEFRLCHRLA